MEREVSFESLKDKNMKLQSIVENYKQEAEKVRESREKKWG